MNAMLLLAVSMCGQTTHPSYVTLSPTKTIRVLQVLDKENVLAHLETMGPRGGGTSMAPLEAGSRALYRALSSSAELVVKQKLLWLVCPTDGMVDGGWGYHDGRTFAYAGTETYKTADGTSTVPKYRLLSPEEAAKHVDPATAGVPDFIAWETWTDKTGERFVGMFIKVEKGKAHFVLREKRQDYSLPVSSLSPESRKRVVQFVKEQKAAKPARKKH